MASIGKRDFLSLLTLLREGKLHNRAPSKQSKTPVCGSAAHVLKLEQDPETHMALWKDGMRACGAVYILSV